MSALALAISPALRAARLQGLLTWLNNGEQHARIGLMGGAWPGAGMEGGAALAMLTLDAPCGALHDDKLLLAYSNALGDVVLQTGQARWARLWSASGAWALDCAVAPEGSSGTGGLWVQGAAAGPDGGALLYAGGRLPNAGLVLL